MWAAFMRNQDNWQAIHPFKCKKKAIFYPKYSKTSFFGALHFGATWCKIVAFLRSVAVDCLNSVKFRIPSQREFFRASRSGRSYPRTEGNRLHHPPTGRRQGSACAVSSGGRRDFVFRMSPSGLVVNRSVNPLPAMLDDWTVLPATNKSAAAVVCKLTLLLVALFPIAPANVSTGLTVSMPLYSKIRMSG
jgi:hypothetical protein